MRAATVLYKRIVEEAVGSGLLTPDELVGPPDEELLLEIRRRAEAEDGPIAERLATRWLPALRNRRLPKRALELTAADLSGVELAGWVVADSSQKRALEDELALELELEPGELVIDFPVKPTMFGLDALIQRRNGSVQRLGDGGLRGVIDLPRVSAELYRAAQVLRVFVFERRELAADRVLQAIGG